jgi:hypothetical protein
MVKQAKEKAKIYPQMTVTKEDITNLPYRDAFDVVISINTIIMPGLKDVREAFHNVCASVKKGGKLLLVLPSMEAVLYHGFLLTEKELGRKPEGLAKRTAKKRFEKHKYDLFFGYYADGKDTQKFYYLHEIEYLLKKEGIKNISIARLEYPWGSASGDYDDFPKEKPIWDWFVEATK